jgi:hypothetical protein
VTLLKDSYFRISLLLSIVSSVFSLSFLDPINWPKQIALVTLTPLVLSYALKGKLRALQNKPLIPVLIGLYVIAGLISLLVNQESLVREMWGTFGRNNGFVTYLCFALLMLAGFALGANSRNLAKILWPIVLMTASAGIYGCMQILYLDPIKWSQDGQAFAFFGNINFASAIFALGAISSVALFILIKPKKGQATILVLFALFQLTLVYLSDSTQGAMMFLISAVLFGFILIQRKSQVVSLLFLFITLLAGILLLFSFMGFGPFGESLFQYTLELRYFYWLSGILIGIKYFWFGAGFDSYGDIYREVRPDSVIEITGIDITVNNAHNTIIQIFATVGIFPALILTSLYFLAFYGCIKSLILPRYSNERKVFSCIFIPLGINSLFSIDNISIGIWNYLFLGIASSFFVFEVPGITEESLIPNPNKSKKVTSTNGDVTRLIGAVASVLGFALAWGSSYPDRAIVTVFQSGSANSQANQVDPRINQLKEVAKSPLARDQNFRYIAEGLSTLGQNELAAAVLYEGIERFPREYQLFDYLAVFLERLNRKEEAVTIREKQIALDPKHPKIWLYLAFDLSDLGRKAEALSAFENVIRLQRYLADDDISKLSEYRQRINNA